MNCKLCERELEAYLDNRLAPDLFLQVEEHLNECQSCSQRLYLEKMASKAILSEKMEIIDPFLSDRIMNIVNEHKIQVEESRVVFMAPSIFKKAAYISSLAAAIFIGIIAGNFYGEASVDDSIPSEMTYINDVQIEAVNLFSNEN